MTHFLPASPPYFNSYSSHYILQNTWKEEMLEGLLTWVRPSELDNSLSLLLLKLCLLLKKWI